MNEIPMNEMFLDEISIPVETRQIKKNGALIFPSTWILMHCIPVQNIMVLKNGLNNRF